MSQSRETIFDCYRESMMSWEGTNNLVYRSGYNAGNTLIRNLQKKSLNNVQGVWSSPNNLPATLSVL